jgi:hypothetical protein
MHNEFVLASRTYEKIQMRNILVYSLVLVPLLFTCGCSKSGSKIEIISEKKMVKLLVETHITDAILYVDNARADEKRDKALFYYPSLLEKQGVTKQQMDSSVSWYMKHPEAYARIYQEVVKELENLTAAAKKDQTNE